VQGTALSYTSLEPARLAALDTGQVRAATLAVPFDAMMAGRGYPVHADAMEMKLDLPITGVTATSARLASRPEEARRVMRTMLRAQQFGCERRGATRGAERRGARAAGRAVRRG
jgi:ABC-type nitrate/sulfonate/bicarbonate transport system substrate-binding protein